MNTSTSGINVDATENYALVFLWASVENHIGICAACAGALKSKWCATYRRVRAISIDLKNKSWLISASTATQTTATVSQSTEDRILYDRTNSNASSLNFVPIDEKETGMRMELVELPSDTWSSVRAVRHSDEE
jgi:hypothetical protein